MILSIYPSSAAITADQIPTAVVADLGGGSGIKKFPYSGRYRYIYHHHQHHLIYHHHTIIIITATIIIIIIISIIIITTTSSTFIIIIIIISLSSSPQPYLPSSSSSLSSYHTGALEVAAFSEFADKFLTGQLKATLKSEEVAPEDTEGELILPLLIEMMKMVVMMKMMMMVVFMLMSMMMMKMVVMMMIMMMILVMMDVIVLGGCICGLILVSYYHIAKLVVTCPLCTTHRRQLSLSPVIGNVKVIKGKSFEDIVLNNTKGESICVVYTAHTLNR